MVRSCNMSQQQQNNSGTFLSMLCSRQSVKDVVVPSMEVRDMSTSADPLSPKIGCMGQVKRSSKAGGLSSSPAKSSVVRSQSRNDTGESIKYSKFKMVVFGKNLTRETALIEARKLRSSKARSCRNMDGYSCSSNGSKIHVSIEDMDPPLPVQRKMAHKEEDDDKGSLWKRRSGGAQLESLQVPPFQVKRKFLEPVTV